MAALIDLCNRALAQIAAGQIADLNEGSIESREASRFAQSLLSELADWTEWPWLIKRAALPQVANDRPAEWLFAYAEPSDLAQPLAIRRVEPDATCLPIAGAYPFPFQDAVPLAYLHEGRKIYTNVEQATLVYAKSTIDAGDLPPLVARAFELELAARIALPIKKDAGLATALQRQAEIARARAIADEENKRSHRPPRYVSDAEYARMGLSDFL
jgi:hypothetical protein